MPRPLFFVVPLLVAITSPAQVLPGDIAITGFNTASFGVASGSATATIYTTGGFLGSGTSQAILHDPANPNDFIVGGFGFIGRATITGPGTVSYALITSAIGTASQLSWDPSGNLIVADAGVDQIQLVTLGGTVVPLSSGTQPWAANVNAGAYERATGDVIVGGSGALYRLPNGSATGVPIATNLGGFVSGIAFDPCNGDILATVLTVNRLVRVDAVGTVTDEIPPGTVAAPNSLDIDELGNYLIGGANGQVFAAVPGGPAILVATASGIGSSASGVAFVSGKTCAYGTACPAPAGMPTLAVAAPFLAGTQLITHSPNHIPFAIGIAVFGVTPLSVPVDPLLGTSGGCLLLASPDFLDVGIVGSLGEFVHILTTNTLFLHQRLFVQHAVLESGPLSSFSLSNGLQVDF